MPNQLTGVCKVFENLHVIKIVDKFSIINVFVKEVLKHEQDFFQLKVLFMFNDSNQY